MSATLEASDCVGGRGCSSQKSWTEKERGPKPSCLFMLLGPKVPTGGWEWAQLKWWSQCSHMQENTGGKPDPTKRSFDLHCGASHFPSTAPFLCKVRERGSAQCLSSLGKQKQLNMAWKQGNSLVLAEVTKFWLDVKRHVNTADFCGFLGNLISIYCWFLSNVKEDIAVLERLHALNHTLQPGCLWIRTIMICLCS